MTGNGEAQPAVIPRLPGFLRLPTPSRIWPSLRLSACPADTPAAAAERGSCPGCLPAPGWCPPTHDQPLPAGTHPPAAPPGQGTLPNPAHGPLLWPRSGPAGGCEPPVPTPALGNAPGDTLPWGRGQLREISHSGTRWLPPIWWEVVILVLIHTFPLDKIIHSYNFPFSLDC